MNLQNNHTNTHVAPQIADVLDDEAVRIFLEFERVESAIKGQCLLVAPSAKPSINLPFIV